MSVKRDGGLIRQEVSDGVIGTRVYGRDAVYPERKEKGNYNVILDRYRLLSVSAEHKEVYGNTFEQGRQELPIDDKLLSNIVTENKEIPEDALRDKKIALDYGISIHSLTPCVT